MSEWRRPSAGALAALFVVALLLRVGFVALRWHEPLLDSDPRHYSNMAKQLVLGEGYHSGKWHAVWPPAWPFAIAGVYAVCGVDNYGAVRLVTAGLSALTCLLVVYAMGPLFGARAALCAGWVTAIYPQLVRYPQTYWSESFYLIWPFATLALLPSALRSRRLGRLLATGACVAISALTRETGLLTLPVLGLWFAVARAELPGGLLRSWLLIALGCLLTILPWTIRNWVVLGGFAPISACTGKNYWRGNNPEADGGFMGMPDDIEAMPELAGNREAMRRALAWDRQHPGQMARLWIAKLRVLWSPPTFELGVHSRFEALQRWAHLLAYLAAWALAIAGWPIARAAWRRSLLPLLLAVIPTLSYVASHVNARHRLGMEVFLLMFAALGVVRLLRAAGLDPDQGAPPCPATT